jgi:hypothetical protein
LYKEWLQKRWVLLIALIIISPSVFLESLMPLTDRLHRYVTITGPNGYIQHSDTVVNTFTWFCNEIVGHMSGGWWASIVVAGLAIYSLWTERNQDVGWFTLLGPVSKRAIMRVKYVFDLAAIAGIFTFLAISLAVIDWMVGTHYPVAGIIRWWVAELAIQGAVYGLSLLLATLMGNVIAVALLTFGILNVPMYLGVALVYALGANLMVFNNPSQYSIPLDWKGMWVFTHLSPLNWFNVDFTHLWTSPWPYFGGFLLFTVLACMASELIYERTANERLSNFFAFKWLKHPALASLSVLMAFFIVRFTGLRSERLTIKVEWLLVLGLAMWGIATLVQRRVLRRH